MGPAPASRPRALARAWVFTAVPFERGGRSCVCVCAAGRVIAAPVAWRGRLRCASALETLATTSPPPPFSRLSCRLAGYDRPPQPSRKWNVIDRLREQIQERLDQLAGEADRLRKALAALDPRSSKAPARKQPGAQACPADQAGAVDNEAHDAPPSQPARGSHPSPDGARRDEGLRARGARRRRRDDRRPGCRQDRPRPADRVDDAVEARQSRRSAEGRARLSNRARFAGEVASRPSFLFTPGGRRYRGRVLPLGFRFDVDAVIVDGVAHRADCQELPARPAAGCGRCRDRRCPSGRALPAGVPALPPAVRDAAHPSARAPSRGAHGLIAPLSSHPVRCC